MPRSRSRKTSGTVVVPEEIMVDHGRIIDGYFTSKVEQEAQQEAQISLTERGWLLLRFDEEKGNLVLRSSHQQMAWDLERIDKQGVPLKVDLKGTPYVITIKSRGFEFNTKEKVSEIRTKAVEIAKKVVGAVFGAVKEALKTMRDKAVDKYTAAKKKVLTAKSKAREKYVVAKSKAKDAAKRKLHIADKVEMEV